ncbi:hypothetical protein J7T55_011812 [Diaporthe amygdali]|uniref:uncharacterized protein n=1 Tax=Phomopsis amygdali TaxID=1214568 RepID=UPI0022FEF09E|nr:uncharacterized protein J7T55_011812 [Diaporthe amygdali]KAJ0123347.1 hypothetical protein J7T55_011812 [Diaporthe amygdali]
MGNNTIKTSFVARHKPSLLVLASQVSAAFIHGIVKILETGQRPVHPFQILQVRLLITGISCMLYLWCNGFPDFPLGPKDVRPLLIVRAVGGVCGAIGFYFSIIYLTIAQATALNFLAPMGAMLISKYFDYGTFSLADRAGAVVALAGVILVVQPDTVFHFTEKATGVTSRSSHETPKQLKGVICGLVGVAGGVIALATIRRIGRRAHPLISVNYFAWAVVIVTTILISIQRLTSPTSSRDWALLVSVGVFGTLMEFLLTDGLSSDTSSAATVMIYSQVLWALALDRVVWHISLNVWSIIGVYETLPAGANDATPDIDLESLCASEDDDETASDGVLDSR